MWTKRGRFGQTIYFCHCYAFEHIGSEYSSKTTKGTNRMDVDMIYDNRCTETLVDIPLHLTGVKKFLNQLSMYSKNDKQSQHVF